MAQHGFFFDQSRCSGCRACSVACKNWHSLPPGPLKYLRVYEYETGSLPDVRLHYHWIPCYHCKNPACAGACPTGALYKEDRYGAVLIHHEKCDGCRLCYDACPYGAPVFESDDPGTPAQKCDMCLDRLAAGDGPVCVLSCPTRALDFGPMTELIKRYGNRRGLEDMPDSGTTCPAAVFKPQAAKRHIVPYDGKKAALLLRREGSPPAPRAGTGRPASATEAGRSRLKIKHGSAADLMRHTRNDEG